MRWQCTFILGLLLKTQFVGFRSEMSETYPKWRISYLQKYTQLPLVYLSFVFPMSLGWKTPIVVLFYVDGFLRWLVLLVYLTVQSQVGFWSDNCTGMWPMLTCICLSKNECLHVCISMLSRGRFIEKNHYSLHSGDRCDVL